MPSVHSKPEVSGPGQWISIHKYAIKCKTSQEKKEFCRYIRIICDGLGCLNCRGHCQEYINKNPPESSPTITTPKGDDVTMFKYTWLFHNDVNRRIGKTQVDWETALNMYSDDNSFMCMSECGVEEVEQTKKPIGLIQLRSNAMSSKFMSRYP